MFNRTMTMSVSDNPHKPGDVLHINDESWMVVRVGGAGYSTKIYLEPLVDVIAKRTVIRINDETITVAEYLASLCAEYESDCTC